MNDMWEGNYRLCISQNEYMIEIFNEENILKAKFIEGENTAILLLWIIDDNHFLFTLNSDDSELFVGIENGTPVIICDKNNDPNCQIAFTKEMNWENGNITKTK